MLPYICKVYCILQNCVADFQYTEKNEQTIFSEIQETGFTKLLRRLKFYL
nr:MAG TPA: hypothetical protein [Caudoviricetes sp.]